MTIQKLAAEFLLRRCHVYYTPPPKESRHLLCEKHRWAVSARGLSGEKPQKLRREPKVAAGNVLGRLLREAMVAAKTFPVEQAKDFGDDAQGLP